MTVTTADRINAVVDGVLARLVANKDDLDITDAEERFETTLKVTQDFAYVLPLSTSGDQMKNHAGGGLGHTYPVTIEIYKAYNDNTAGIRAIRNRGYKVADLFCKGSNMVLTVELDGTPVHAFSRDPLLEVGGFLTKGDYVMFWCSVTFQTKMEE